MLPTTAPPTHNFLHLNDTNGNTFRQRGAILLTTFSNKFWWMKNMFWFNFHWSLFQMIQLTILLDNDSLRISLFLFSLFFCSIWHHFPRLACQSQWRPISVHHTPRHSAHHGCLADLRPPEGYNNNRARHSGGHYWQTNLGPISI